MLLDLRLEQLPAMHTQALERVDLVPLHEPAVAGHVGSEDGGKPAFHGKPYRSTPAVGPH
jgi:hypothetical protein